MYTVQMMHFKIIFTNAAKKMTNKIRDKTMKMKKKTYAHTYMKYDN